MLFKCFLCLHAYFPRASNALLADRTHSLINRVGDIVTRANLNLSQTGLRGVAHFDATGQRSIVRDSKACRSASGLSTMDTRLSLALPTPALAAAKGRWVADATCLLRHPWLRSQEASCHRGHQGGGILPPQGVFCGANVLPMAFELRDHAGFADVVNGSCWQSRRARERM